MYWNPACARVTLCPSAHLTSFTVFFNEVSADVVRRDIPVGDRSINLTG
jgi:hypothetical protein